MASHYELSRSGHGWNATYFDESGRPVGEGSGMTARGARHRAGAAARAKLRSELGHMRSRRHYHLYRAERGASSQPMTRGYATKEQAKRSLAEVESSHRGWAHPPKVKVGSCTDPGCAMVAGQSRSRVRYHSHPAHPSSHPIGTKHRRAR